MHEIWKFDQMQDFTTESSQLLQYKFKLKIIVGFVWFHFKISNPKKTGAYQALIIGQWFIVCCYFNIGI